MLQVVIASSLLGLDCRRFWEMLLFVGRGFQYAR